MAHASNNVRSGLTSLRRGSRVVVVGNGMVSHRFCARLRELASERELDIVIFGEESRPAYDRVQLTSYFDVDSAEALLLSDEAWYAQRGIDLRLGERVTRIDRDAKRVQTARGTMERYDVLVLCSGSAPFVPPMPGVDLGGVFVYRTIEDLDAIRDYATRASRCAVLGGGLLGLEAARAVQQLGLETSVVELAPRLMPRQVDDIGGQLLERAIEALGVHVHLGRRTQHIEGDGSVRRLAFAEGEPLDVDMVVISAGIRPRDELAREAGIEVGERGGIVVDDSLRTSDPDVYAIGEVALHRGRVYGLVAPGYDMAEALAKVFAGTDDASFTGADVSTKLKLMGVDVASFGDPFADGEGVQTIAFQDFVQGVYKKLLLSPCGTKLLGGMLVGDATEYGSLLHYARSGAALPENPESLILGDRGGQSGSSLDALPDEAQVCSCNNVSKGDLCRVIESEAAQTVPELKSCTQAGTGCGGCLPMVNDLLKAELAKLGKSTRQPLCEHFDYTRQELFDLARVQGIDSFEELIGRHGKGEGCEICKPTAASIFASLHNGMILEKHAALQDTNDRFLANIQRRGLYSVVPRVPGGEITPEKLIVLGEVAKKHGLYTKITGGQRVDLFGARLEQLPDIWEELIAAGFESGHAYGKAMRTVKSCVGSTWCRYGVQDSVGMAIHLEERYRGLRAPHKLKSAVSGCIRECAEAQSKDFGVIATENGYNLYVCGNGGSKPRHADLLAADVDPDTLVRYIDRFLMYYIRTADKLTRTSKWVESLEGGIDHVRDVVVHDSLGLAEELEARMQHLVDTYQCEWKAVVEDPERRAMFRHFANAEEGDDTIELVDERGQRRPLGWDKTESEARGKHRLPVVTSEQAGAERGWVRAGRLEDFPEDGGLAVKHGDTQIAVFHFKSKGRWYAAQNMCPHREDMVLARGLLGDRAGEPKVACPMHKKTFSLESGECLSGDDFAIQTFPVKVEEGEVFVRLPPAETLRPSLCPKHVVDQPVAAE